MLRADHGILAVLVFMTLLPFEVAASSPGMIEGPSGCTWNASVVSVQDTKITLKLDTMYGACMQYPHPCGKKDDIVTAIRTDAQKSLNMGDKTHVWVDNAGATFTPPACSRQPINP